MENLGGARLSNGVAGIVPNSPGYGARKFWGEFQGGNKRFTLMLESVG